MSQKKKRSPAAANGTGKIGNAPNSTRKPARNQSRRQRCAWSLDDLLAADRNAATVYIAIRWLAAGRRRWQGTRKTLAGVCGLHRQTITKAVAALAEGGWLTLSYGRRGGKSWYELTFGEAVLPEAGKTVPCGASNRRKNRPQSRVVRERKNRPPFSIEKDASAGRAAAGGGPAPASGQGGDPRPEKDDGPFVDLAAIFATKGATP